MNGLCFVVFSSKLCAVAVNFIYNFSIVGDLLDDLTASQVAFSSTACKLLHFTIYHVQGNVALCK